MSTKTYSEKLKDPRWQKKRLEIMQRDSFSCCSCSGSDNTLHVHHLQYERGKEPWDYQNSSLATLCESCHVFEHDHDSIKEDLIKMLKSKGFTNDNLLSIMEGTFLFNRDTTSPNDVADVIFHLMCDSSLVSEILALIRSRQ
jgi:hypothetical protein